MAVAEASQTRLAEVPEVTIGTLPATPTWQTMRYLSSTVRPVKQTEITDEIRADRNVPSITDVGRNVEGSIKTNISYGTYDTWLERLLCNTWSTNVLKNGILDKTAALEWMFKTGATEAYIRALGCRWDTLDMRLESKKAIEADWGIKGLSVPTPATVIVTGATYTAPSVTPVLNAALNVAALTVSGITNPPKLKSLNLSIKNNLYANDVIGQYETYSHGKGRFEVSGSMACYFENLDTFNAVLNHDDVGLSFTIGALTAQKYTFALPKLKLMDGGPPVQGNGQAVMMDVPFQAFYDGTSAASITITRAVA